MKLEIDTDFLKTHQYASSANLEARISVHRRFTVNPTSLWKWIWGLYQLKPSEEVLDIGCGSGEFWRENIAHVPPGLRITCSDFSEGMLADCRRNLAVLPQIEYRAADIQNLPFADRSFDRIFCHFMLYHVPNKARACEELLRTLKPSGSCYFITNSSGHLGQFYSLAREIDPDFQYNANEGIRSFEEENAEEVLRPHFSCIEKHVFETSLRITEVEPAVAFLRSFSQCSDVGEEFWRRYAMAVGERIRTRGSFDVDKRSALFIAR